METIRMLKIEPMKAPVLIEVEHTLEKLQELVGGMVQVVYPWDDMVALLCDDDGKGKGYPPNRVLVDEDDGSGDKNVDIETFNRDFEVTAIISM